VGSLHQKDETVNRAGSFQDGSFRLRVKNDGAIGAAHADVYERRRRGWFAGATSWRALP